MEPTPWLGFSPDIGAILGGGVTFYRYGFRYRPFRWRQTIRAAFSTGAQRFKGEYDAAFHPRNSGMRYNILARGSGIEIIRFHGFGNETRLEEPREHYEVEQEQYVFEPTVSFPLSPRAHLSLGPTLKHARTQLDASPFLATVRPYGAERFSQLGARAAVTVDTRDRPGYPERGVHLNVGGVVYPEVWDATSTFGAAEAEASTYLRVGGPILALRAGGKQTFGTYPFHEAAFLGGSATLRGWTEQRFAGDAAVYGSAELRAYLSEIFIILPGELGVFALADGGRVFLDAESSDTWHSAFGGGLWIAFLDRANTISIAYANGKERGGLYVNLGFTF
jgi:outer membrane protein assembly factor BamA